MLKKLIAVLGMPGSGKSEVIQYLQKKYSWPKVYFGGVTLDEVKRRGLEVNEKNERLVRESLRDEFGEDHYAKVIIKKVDEIKDAPYVLADGLYSWVEYRVLKERFKDKLTLVTIHAAPKIRHARLMNRLVRPLAKEVAESRDIAQLERFLQGNPIALSDFVIINEGSVEKLHTQVDKVIEVLEKQ